MEEKALYVLAQFDAETQNKLAGYYGLLQQDGLIGTQTKDIPYHITLGSFGPECEKQMTEALDKIGSETDSFEIKLDHIGLFGRNVLFLAPNVNFELLTLQDRFFPNSAYGCHSWAAHTTLLLDEPAQILRAFLALAIQFKPFQARIESVGLYEFFPARLIKEKKLNK